MLGYIQTGDQKKAGDWETPEQPLNRNGVKKEISSETGHSQFVKGQLPAVLGDS